ncbi:MAG: S-layer homology domain-containing protein, partial [Clostridia bacterium]|nr:S-layer homology domain-containing protein [Clostridia bacterium]
REAAISARYRLTSSTVATVVEEPSIPDFNTISEVYREDIIGAYRVGLTTGVDEDGTFMPKAELRRAEVCQLYYNMWN